LQKKGKGFFWEIGLTQVYPKYTSRHLRARALSKRKTISGKLKLMSKRELYSDELCKEGEDNRAVFVVYITPYFKRKSRAGYARAVMELYREIGG
jgi:hypothetical protein